MIAMTILTVHVPQLPQPARSESRSGPEKAGEPLPRNTTRAAAAPVTPSAIGGASQEDENQNPEGALPERETIHRRACAGRCTGQVSTRRFPATDGRTRARRDGCGGG